VRRVLGGGVIADRETVRLNLDEVTTDLADFHAAVDEAAIVAAYTGEFLPEDRYDDWTGPTRDEARSRFVSAARDLATRYREQKRYRESAELSRRLIETDRYDEDAHRMLVETLVAAGEPGEAGHAHAAWSAAMAKLGIDVEPMGSGGRS
jgi:DNA-binding SARP family transcriptional activator